MPVRVITMESGVTFSVLDEVVEIDAPPMLKSQGGKIVVTMYDLKHLVADYVRRRRHQMLDEMIDEDLLTAWGIR